MGIGDFFFLLPYENVAFVDEIPNGNWRRDISASFYFDDFIVGEIPNGNGNARPGANSIV